MATAIFFPGWSGLAMEECGGNDVVCPIPMFLATWRVGVS